MWFRVSGVTESGERVEVRIEASDSERALFFGWDELARVHVIDIETLTAVELPTDQALRAAGVRSLFDAGMVG